MCMIFSHPHYSQKVSKVVFHTFRDSLNFKLCCVCFQLMFPVVKKLDWILLRLLDLRRSSSLLCNTLVRACFTTVCCHFYPSTTSQSFRHLDQRKWSVRGSNPTHFVAQSLAVPFSALPLQIQFLHISFLFSGCASVAENCIASAKMLYLIL